MLHSICQQIWKTQQWPQDWKWSVFIPNPKKDNSQNVQTSAQLHTSHTLAKWCSKFSKPDINSMWTVNFQMFKLDLERQRSQRSNCQQPLDHRKTKRIPEKHLLLLYWLHQSLCVDHKILWKILKEMGTPDHLACLLRNLYAGQETVRTRHGTMDWFQIGKGIRQGYIFSP